MRIITFNGPKTAHSIFAGICVLAIVYFGFVNTNSAVEVSGEPVKTTYLAIIIDGFGNSTSGTKEFLYMDSAFTGAVIPGQSKTDEESRLLHSSGKEVIVHIPLEQKKKDKSKLVKDVISPKNSPDEVKDFMEKAISQVSFCTGIMIADESKVIENKELAIAIASAANDKGMYFINSVDSGKSKADEAAKEAKINFYTPDIILDSTKDIKKIEKNLIKAGELAVKNGYTIALGHLGNDGGKATAQAIKNTLPLLEEKGIKLVTMSELKEILESNKK